MNETLLWNLGLLIGYVILVIATGLILRFINKSCGTFFPVGLCFIPIMNLAIIIVVVGIYLISTYLPRILDYFNAED